jgi:hypothetical protein
MLVYVVALNRVELVPACASAFRPEVPVCRHAGCLCQRDRVLTGDHDVGRLLCDDAGDLDSVFDARHRTGTAGRPVAGH